MSRFTMAKEFDLDYCSIPRLLENFGDLRINFKN